MRIKLGYTPLSITRDGWIALGAYIRSCREALRWKLEDVIERIDTLYQSQGSQSPISKATLSNIERGVGQPKIENLLPLVALRYITNPNGEPMSFADLVAYAGRHGGMVLEVRAVAETPGTYDASPKLVAGSSCKLVAG